MGFVNVNIILCIFLGYINNFFDFVLVMDSRHAVKIIKANAMTMFGVETIILINFIYICNKNIKYQYVLPKIYCKF